jgi:hypothetical protein
LKRILEFVWIIIIMSQLFYCGPSQLTITPTFSNTYSPSNTPKPLPSSTLQATNIPRPKPPPTPQVLENGWNRFTYTEAGYYIDYPPDATLFLDNSIGLDYSEAIISFSRSVDETGVVMEIFTDLNKENKSLDQFAHEGINRICNGQPPKVNGIIIINTSIIEGHSALTFNSIPNSPIVFIESRDRFYELILMRNMMIGNTPTNDAVDLFYKILITFTIL